MDEEQKFWTTIFKYLSIAFCVFVTSMAGCTANRHYQIRVVIESGKTDAIGARCAIDSDASTACHEQAVRDMVNAPRR